MTASPTAFGKYELLEVLARGGMAEVWKARSRGVEGFEKILVVKRILPRFSGNARFVDMFIHEAKTAVTLSHANIVQVFDLGCHDGTYFIAMEYVAGMDLAALLAQAKAQSMPLPAEIAVFIASEIAKALDYAHRRRDSKGQPLGIVHRDVSPHNVLLSYEGEVKLADFGIVRALDAVEEPGEAESPMGKLLYMAPEQARRRDVDPTADLYSLGVVLYEMLSGQNPFASENVVEAVSQVEAGLAPPLHTRAPHVSAELGALVGRMMAPRKEDRIPTAGKLYEDLLQFLYSGGRRASAYDLSRYMDELRDALERSASGPALPAARGGLEAVQRTGAGQTAAESPLGRPTDRPRAMGEESDAEAHETATLVGVSMPLGEETSESAVRSLVRRFAGTVVERHQDATARTFLVVFRAGEGGGRDVEAAARCAVRIARLADAQTQGSGARVVVHASSMASGAAGAPDVARLSADMAHVKALLASSGQGEVIATKASERALRVFFRLEPVPHASEPLFRILGERVVAEAFGRFVGRKEELKRIGEVLALANRGKRRVLFLDGPEGIGKSRLLHETVRRLRLGNHPVNMHLVPVARADVSSPLSSIRELLRTLIGVDEFDPEPILRRKVERLRELGISPSELASVAVHLGLRVEGEGRRTLRPLRAALGHIARKLAEDCLTVFAFDGADTMDAASERMLGKLMEDVRSSRAAFVFAYRDPKANPWTHLQRSYPITVAPFAQDEMDELIRARLRSEKVSEAVVAEVTQTCAGNPLHAEEFMRALERTGAIATRDGEVVLANAAAVGPLRAGVRALLRDRVGSLDPTDLAVLRAVAVAGTRVSPQLVARVLREEMPTVLRALGVLEGLGFVSRRGASEYVTWSESVRQAVEAGMEPAERAAMHGEVAAAVEQLFPARVDELAERLVRHVHAAGAYEKAIALWGRAADRLEQEGAFEHAVGALRAAVDLLIEQGSPDRERVLALYWRIAQLCVRAGRVDGGVELLSGAVDIAENLGREDYVARYLMTLGRVLIAENRFAEGQAAFERARRTARNAGNRDVLRDIVLGVAESQHRNGRFAEDPQVLSEALSVARESGDLRAQVRCLFVLAVTHAARGESTEATDYLDQANAIVGLHPDRTADAEALSAEALVQLLLERYADAADAAERALELTRAANAPDAAQVALLHGMARLHQGQDKQALALFRLCQELAAEVGDRKAEYAGLCAVGAVEALKLDSAEGEARVRAALAYAERHGYEGDALEAKYALVAIDGRAGRRETAERLLSEVLASAALLGNRRILRGAERAQRAISVGTPIEFP